MGPSSLLSHRAVVRGRQNAPEAKGRHIVKLRGGLWMQMPRIGECIFRVRAQRCICSI